MTSVLRGISSFRSGLRVGRPPAAPHGRHRVSVVVPCYNYGHFLPDCVASALDQPGVEADVVVVDDASTDGSGDRAEQLAEADGRISVIRHARNMGHIATYNDGLKAAGGEYLVLLSADDLLSPGSLARAAALLEEKPSVGLVYGRSVQFVGDPPKGPVGPLQSWTIWDGDQWLKMRWRTARNCIWSPEAMIRATVQRQIGGYNSQLPHSADLEMWMRAAATSDVGHVDGTDQAYYRLHADNMHRTTFQSESSRGILVDLQERWLTFEQLAHRAPDPTTDIASARRALSVEALTVAARSITWGQPDPSLVRELADFAAEVYPEAPHLRLWNPVQRLIAMGPARARRHPAFVVREFIESTKDSARRWRWAQRGV